MREGPLCDEPIRNVNFRLIHAALSNTERLRARGQVIPTVSRVCCSSFLLSTPRLMEPILSAQIQCPADCVAVIKPLLRRRRGHDFRTRPVPATPLFLVDAEIPMLDSFGFETDLRVATKGQAFCMTYFDHWGIVDGDPLDQSIVLRPLEPVPNFALARELMVKTRRRKGLAGEVTLNKYFDDAMLMEMARQQGMMQTDMNHA